VTDNHSGPSSATGANVWTFDRRGLAGERPKPPRVTQRPALRHSTTMAGCILEIWSTTMMNGTSMWSIARRMRSSPEARTLYPAEIEAVLYRNPVVHVCAVEGALDDRVGEVGFVYVVPKKGASATLYGTQARGPTGRTAGLGRRQDTEDGTAQPICVNAASQLLSWTLEIGG